MFWRNIEWGNIIQQHDKTAFLCQRGSGKSMAPDTLVVMYNGTLKEIQHICVGDRVMGVDSTPRTVLSIHRGVDQMYCVEQTNTENYVTNSEHLLHFKRGSHISWRDKSGCHRKKMIFDDTHTHIVEMPTKEFHAQSPLYKRQSFGYRILGWELEEKVQKIEPYYLGIWLGDGTSVNQDITTIDNEVKIYLQEYSVRLGLDLSVTRDKRTFKLKIDTRGRGLRNPLIEALKFYNLLNNKHIPDDYLLGSRQQRLQLLAGLIDSDGTLTRNKTSYSITQKNEYLLKQIQRLCWSLGFRANIKKRVKKLKFKQNLPYTSFELHISGIVWDIPCKIERKKIEPFIRVQDPQRSRLNTHSIGLGEYYGFECDGDKLFLLRDGTVVHNSYFFCYALPLWRLYSYDKPRFFERDSIDNRNRKETCLITNEYTLVKEHTGKIIEQIKSNDALSEKLNPNGKAKLGVEGIVTETGSILHLRTYGSQIRGLHVGGVIVDDFLDRSAIYSKEQRAKFFEVFFAEIMNILEPDGMMVVSGTPFHEKDLYNDLKDDQTFWTFEYPGIFPDGRILAPDRWNYKKLMSLKKSLGTTVFSREILVKPISDTSSLFPWSYLNRAFVGMENVRLVDNINSFPVKLERVVTACDLAISGAIGADKCAFITGGIDNFGKIYVMNIFNGKGVSHNEQVSQIIRIDNNFRPHEIVIENNAFQRVIAELVRERGLKNVTEFTTTAIKRDLYQGLPALSAAFERGDIKLPHSVDEYTRNAVTSLCEELNSISYNEDKNKLESVGGHDDQGMALWILFFSLMKNKGRFTIDWV